jgi:hypothetical protein
MSHLFFNFTDPIDLFKAIVVDIIFDNELVFFDAAVIVVVIIARVCFLFGLFNHSRFIFGDCNWLFFFFFNGLFGFLSLRGRNRLAWLSLAEIYLKEVFIWILTFVAKRLHSKKDTIVTTFSSHL